MRRELAKTGMFGQDGTRVTAKDLRECAATFDGKAPVVLGHQLADWMPKFGDVKKAWLEERGPEDVSLLGDVEVNDLLADAIDAKFYEDMSIGIATRKADGKRYIHHLAFLGAVPPKIRDLRVFGDIGSCYLGDGGLDGVTEVGPTEAPKVAPQATPQTATVATTSPAPAPEAKGGKEEDVELKEENAKLTKELADMKASQLAAGKESLRKAMEGRVPKARQGLVILLADRLCETSKIELADESGGKENVDGIEALRRVLEAIPLAVTPGKAELGDPAGNGKPLDLSAIAGKF